MRPWIGVTKVDYEAPPPDGRRARTHYILVHYQNTGLLPARSLTIDLSARSVVPNGAQPNANDGTLNLLGEHVGTVFPGEDNVQRFRVLEAGLGRITIWLAEGRDVRLTGSITYRFEGETTYVTTFHAVIAAETDKIQSWANDSAT